MIVKKPLVPDRIRKIIGSFAFIEHRFLRGDFWTSLGHYELLLYFFLVIVGDRSGLSYYGYDKICTFLRISVDEYILARNCLIKKDLIAFDGHLFQVLSLPEKLVEPCCFPLKNQKEMERYDPATIHQTIVETFGENRG